MSSPAEPSVTPEPAPAVGKRKPRKIILFGLLALFLAAGGVAYLLLSEDSGSHAAGSAASTPPAERFILPLEPFLVNLADREARRYLKLRVELEVDQEKTAGELKKSLPLIRDALILLLGNKTYADISTAEGKGHLKSEILQRLAALPGGRKVTNVYFTEFVAQ